VAEQHRAVGAFDHDRLADIAIAAGVEVRLQTAADHFPAPGL
jgi:hypothetical protein